MTRRAVVLFGHGSRDPVWSQPMEAVAARMQVLDPSVPVRCAYLEFMQPDLAAAVGILVADGASQISVLPILLGVGRHAREDLPKLMEAAALRYPAVSLNLQPAIGENSRVVDLIAEIALS